MAVPTAPTLTTLTTEGLKKAGVSNPSSTLLTRAQDWMEEIKNDIYILADGRKLKSLYVTSHAPTVNGRGVYSNPSDYYSDLSLQIMTGSIFGTAQSGTANTITLASDETAGELDLLGQEVFIYTGTAAGDLSQITTYDSSTKVATVSPNFNTNPDNTSGYLIVSTYYHLNSVPVWDISRLSTPTQRGLPTHFAPTGDSDYGEFILYPVPYNDTVIYGMKMRYYANLMTMDLTGTTIATLYQRLRNVWIQGIKTFYLEENKQSHAPRERAKYDMYLQQGVSAETYGNTLNHLRLTVEDYA